MGSHYGNVISRLSSRSGARRRLSPCGGGSWCSGGWNRRGEEAALRSFRSRNRKSLSSRPSQGRGRFDGSGSGHPSTRGYWN